MSSYQYRKSHCEDKMILRPSYCHNGISYPGKMTSLYWIKALESVYILGWNTVILLTGMLKSLHSLGSCAENFPLIQISSILSVIFTRLWIKCQIVFWWTSCTSARHAGSFDCLMTSLILITMDNGSGHCAYWQSCKVPNQTHRGMKKNR